MKDRIVILTGGVGGAKLVLGMAQIVLPERIAAIVNTGDDFRHLGLAVSPDLDTLLYTLAGKADARQGWGREGESWNFMDALRSLGGEDWFQLGDGDLALHVVRTARLAKGDSLSAIARDFALAWGVKVNMLPMSDDPVSTFLSTDEGRLSFQRYFVARHCAPAVKEIHFDAAAEARPGPGVVEAIRDPDNRAILIAPSNPYLSIDPILAVPEIRRALAAAGAPRVAVSPIVGGQAVKGPTAKLMGDWGLAITPGAIADHYAGLIDAILVDERDPPQALPIAQSFADTLMNDLADRVRVAQAALDLADRIRR